MSLEKFENRIIPLSKSQMQALLENKGMTSYAQLLPNSIRLKKALDLPKEALLEQEYLNFLQLIASDNKPYRSFIGMGYYKTITPEVLMRGVFENPFAFKSETQDNFQAMISSLTGMEYSYSICEQAQACAMSMELMFNSRENKDKKTLFIDQNIYPYLLDVLLTYCEALSIDIVQDDFKEYEFSGNEFGAIIQYPAMNGEIIDYSNFTQIAHNKDVKITAICDLMSLCLLVPPCAWGADYAIGSTQRFGLPMAFGGANSAFLACKTQQEICVEYNPMATLSSFYAIYYGGERLQEVAKHINIQTSKLCQTLKSLGADIICSNVFDTLEINIDTAVVSQGAIERGINLYYIDEQRVRLSLDECTTDDDLLVIVEVFAEALGKKCPKNLKQVKQISINEVNLRKDEILTQEVFNKYHTESSILQYIKTLESKQINISCIEPSRALNMSEFTDIHPFEPDNQHEGYLEILDELSNYFSIIMGLESCSLQASSFSQGEFSCMIIVKSYYQAKGQFYRDLVLVPTGYNSEQISKAGMRIAYYSDDIDKKIEQHQGELAMVIADFRDKINLNELTEQAHQAGAQVYLYTKNMDSLVSLTNAGYIGADIACFNFETSTGVVCAASHLTDYLPTHCIVEAGGIKGMTAINSSAYGDVLNHLTSYGYIKLMGEKGLKRAALYKNLIKE